MKNKPIHFGDKSIQPGESVTIALPTPEIYTCAPMYIPIHVVHGKKSGPCLLVCSSIHGDETNGLAIIQRLIQMRLLKSLRGTLIAIPVINIYGLITNSRVLPDRRDLDGSFPGSESGSYASRLAYYLTKEIFDKVDFCVDIHSGEPHFSKFPQIHTNVQIPEARSMSKNFQAPIILHTESSRGMLWLMKEKRKPTVIYETGEALRFDELGIRTGIRGILKVMKSLEMLKFNKPLKPFKSFLFHSAVWIYAPQSGLCQLLKKNGSHVKKGNLIFRISDPFGTKHSYEGSYDLEGVVIAQNNMPLVNEGDPILQIATFEEASEAGMHIDEWKKEEWGTSQL